MAKKIFLLKQYAAILLMITSNLKFLLLNLSMDNTTDMLSHKSN